MAKVSVNIATYPARSKHLKKVVEALLPQCDVVRIYLNEYTEAPQWIKDNHKIEYHIGEDLKDIGKFWWCQELHDEIYLTCDDDFIYSNGYVNKHKQAILKYKAVVFSHGRVLRQNPQTYQDCSELYPFWIRLVTDKFINYGGTGTMGFDNSLLAVDLNIFKVKGKTDEYFNLALQRHKVPMVCRSHEKNEMLQLEYPESLWQTNKSETKHLAELYRSKKRIAICIPFWKREEITRFTFNYYKELTTKLDCELICIAVGSEGQQSKQIAEDYGFHYFEEDNNVSAKYNRAFLESKEFNVDASIKVDSDTIISKEIFDYYIDCINRGVDYTGITDIYFAFQNHYCYWSGYKGKRQDEPTGVGRFLSKRLLERINYKIIPSETKCSNDYVMTKLIDTIECNKEFNTCKNLNGFIIDLKSEEQITSLNDFRYETIDYIDKCPIDLKEIKGLLMDSSYSDKKIKVGAIYSTFYDMDMIEDSINSIKSVVDHIVVVHQKKSFAGVKEPKINTEIIKRLVNNNLINDIVYYEGTDATNGMIDKLNVGLEYIKKNGCDYVISMSADECYNSNEIRAEIEDMEVNSIQTLYMPIKAYYYDKNHYFIDTYFTQSIHKVDERIYERSESAYLCDPQRKMKQGKYKLSKYFMHHYTFLKDKYSNKLNNSIRAIVVSRHKSEMQQIYDRLQSWEQGDKALVFGNDMTRNGRVVLMEKELSVIDSFSVIIPTMWKSPYIFEMLDIYERNKNISEIIIIDNDISKNTDLSKYTKVKQLKQEQNIFVNPAWNLGVEQANGNFIAIINDDIIIDEANFNEILKFSFSLKGNEMIGVNEHCYSKKGLDTTGLKIVKSEKMGYGFGCLMIMQRKNYKVIPSDFKIWYGDDFQYNNNKVFEIKGIEIKTNMSQTVNSFRGAITQQDILNWNKNKTK